MATVESVVTSESSAVSTEAVAVPRPPPEVPTWGKILFALTR